MAKKALEILEMALASKHETPSISIELCKFPILIRNKSSVFFFFFSFLGINGKRLVPKSVHKGLSCHLRQLLGLEA